MVVRFAVSLGIDTALEPLASSSLCLHFLCKPLPHKRGVVTARWAKEPLLTHGLSIRQNLNLSDPIFLSISNDFSIVGEGQ